MDLVTQIKYFEDQGYVLHTVRESFSTFNDDILLIFGKDLTFTEKIMRSQSSLSEDDFFELIRRSSCSYNLIAVPNKHMTQLHNLLWVI